MKKIFDNIEIAVDVLIDATKKHSHASEQGDYKIANKNFDLAQKAIYFLRENNRIDKLEELLDSEDISVRLKVASYFLFHNKEKAFSVLEEIVNQSIPHKSFHAKMVLEEFKKGNLNL